MYSPMIPNMPIKKSNEAIATYQKVGPIFGEILYSLYKDIKEGNYINVERNFIDKCEKEFNSSYIKKLTFYPDLNTKFGYPFYNQKNYLDHYFNHPICVSINDEVAHGKPYSKRLQEIKTGDVVSVDCGLSLKLSLTKSINLDAAFTVAVGEDKDWIKKPQMALQDIVKDNPKNTMDIASIIQYRARMEKLKQVVSLTGHGIGHSLHEAPVIHNAPADFPSVNLFDGLCFCAEPIYVQPNKKEDDSFISSIYLADDGWTVLTASGSPSSHFETTYTVIDGQIVDLVGVSNWIL